MTDGGDAIGMYMGYGTPVVGRNCFGVLMEILNKTWAAIPDPTPDSFAHRRGEGRIVARVGDSVASVAKDIGKREATHTVGSRQGMRRVGSSVGKRVRRRSLSAHVVGASAFHYHA